MRDPLERVTNLLALLLESRLVKDVQPRFNSDLKDDKTFPYLQITTHEDFPRVELNPELIPEIWLDPPVELPPVEVEG